MATGLSALKAQARQRGAGTVEAPNFLESLLSGILRPIFSAAGAPLEFFNLGLQDLQGFQAGRGIEGARQQALQQVIPDESSEQRQLRITEAIQQTQSPRGELDFLFETPESLERINTDPFGETARRTAGVGAFLVPGAAAFGGGIPGLITSGVLGGGLAGVGAAEPGQELESGFRGALTGGAVGGGLGLLGKGLGKIAGARKATQEVAEVAGAPLPKSISGKGIGFRAKRLGLKTGSRIGEFPSPRAADTAGKTIIGEFDQLGLPTGTKDDLANSLIDAIGIRSRQADELLTQSGVEFQGGGNDILNEFLAKFNNAPKIRNEPTAQRLLLDLIDLGDNPSAAELNQFRRFVDKFIPDRAFEKSSQELTHQGEAVRAIRDIISQKLKGEPALAPFKQVLGRQSTLLNARRAILGSAGRGTKGIGSPLLVSGFRLPTGGITERLQDIAGKVAGGKGPGGGIIGGAGEVLAPIAGGISKIGTSPLGREVARLLPAGVVGGQAEQRRLGVFGEAQPGVTFEGEQATGLPISQLPGQGVMPGVGGKSPLMGGTLGGQEGDASRAQRAQMAIGLLNQGLSPLDVERVFGLLGIGEGALGGQLDLSESQRKDLRSIARAESLLDVFERGLTQVGLEESPFGARISGTLRGIGASTGLVPDAQLTAFNAAREGLISNLSRALGESGVLTDQDIARAIGLIPSASDSREEASLKLQNLRQIFAAGRQTALAF